MARLYAIVVRKILAVAVAWVLALSVQAQELEYALELGAMAGPSFYMGDANLNGFYKQTTLAGALMGRYNFTPRTALKFNLGYGKVKGDATKETNRFPEREGREWRFDNGIVDAGCQFELNFWGYGTGTGYKGHKRLTPYIQAGVGLVFGSNTAALNLPVGFGIKYKIKPRLNVGLDWTMRLSTSDKLDGLEDPYGIESGMFKNKDSYSWTMVYVTYDLCPKYRKCNNE